VSREGEPLDLVRRLIAVTEAQLAAARRLDGASLVELNDRRGDLVFALRVVLQDPLPDDPELRRTIGDEARRLAGLERRLAHLAGVVLATLERIAPSSHPPTRYSRGVRRASP
jgi:hypothetical protein